MSCPPLDGQLFQLLQELRVLSLSEEVWVSPELICFLESRSEDGGVGVRSQLQTELILRSLNPSSARQLVKALL